MRRGIICGIIILSCTSLVCQAQDMRIRKKLIATGWDEPDAQRLLQNYREMEKQPFDGVVVNIDGRVDEQKRCSLRPAFSTERWERRWFQEPVDQLKACKFQRFTDNFLIIGANPGNVDWFDDDGWARIVEHWRIAAWVAKESGFRGILFDPEPYSEPYVQFKYAAQAQRDRHTFDEYYAKARERGRQVMQGIAEEYPNITLFCYFLNSVVGSATGQADPRPALAGDGYGLLPAFLDGWLDAIPPTITLVDGCESAYLYNSIEQYLEAGLLIKGTCQSLVSPENRAKYRAQVQASFGIYLDAYVNPPTSPWYIDGKGQPRVKRLRENARAALRVADEYVWVYGEKYRWWPTPNKSVKEQSWPEILSGCDDALRLARDPADYGRTRMSKLRESGSMLNLMRNAEFGLGKVGADQWKEGQPPVGWSTWQEERSKGTFTWDRQTGCQEKGSAKATGVSHGCFLQSCDAKAGELYAVRAMRRLAGKGEATIRIRWQTSEGKWIAETQDVMLYADGAREDWRELFGVAEVPQEAGKLVVLLSVTGQQSPADVAWFDDVEVCKVE
jgi:hypothetical protein